MAFVTGITCPVMLYQLKNYLHRRQHRERYRLLDRLLHNQTLSKEQLLIQQKLALADIIQHAYSTTSYYQEKYAQSPRNNAHEPITDSLPILHKDEVVQHREEMLARNIDKRALSIGHTGGSTGKPVSFYYDQHKHEMMRAGMCRSYMWSGWMPGQKILNFWGARQDILRQDILHGNSFSQKYQDYVAAEKTIAAHEYSEAQLHDWAKSIRSYRPILLQGYASILAELSRYIIANNIQMPNTILGIYSTAEMLYDGQRKLMEQAFRCKVFNQYGSREIPNIACECRHGNQHIFTDMVYLESQHINQEDRLIITSLTNKIMPFIRYDIGDSGKLKGGDCACGSPFPMMEMGLCRSNDLIKTRNGKSIHPSYFNRLLYGQTYIRQYQYVQSELDKITLNIVSPIKLQIETINSLKERVRRDIDENMVLEINYVDEIRRSISGKHRFVISNLKISN